MDVEEFGTLFDRFERSAFRVEARDRYDVMTNAKNSRRSSRATICGLEQFKAIPGWPS